MYCWKVTSAFVRQCKINYCHGIHITVYPLYQLWAVSNKTTHYPFLVSQKMDQSKSLPLKDYPYGKNVEEIMNF